MAAPAPPPEEFEREHGCTEAEWLGWLPGAVGAHALTLNEHGKATVTIGSGRLDLLWHPLPVRQIALIRLPRLRVRYRFHGVDDAQRAATMHYFDLTMQRGGG